jgi:hypothetical protein
MDQTDIWMLGVGSFGVAFYLLSLYYHRVGDEQRETDEQDT